MNKYISGAYGVEIPLNAQNKKIFLPDVSILRNKRIKHIDFCNYSDLPKAPSGRDIINPSPYNIYFTFTEQNTQLHLLDSIHYKILEPLHRSNLGSRLYINKIIDLSKSFVDLSTVPDNKITGKSIYLVFYFDNPDNWGFIPKVRRTSILPLEIKLRDKKTYFDENLNFKNKKIQKLIFSEVYFTPTGNEGINHNHFHNKFLTLSKANKEFVYRLPLYLLEEIAFIFTHNFQNVEVDLQSSYIETLTTTANDLKSVFFNAIIDDNK